MNNEFRSQYLGRASILKLLSDEQIARVSKADSAPLLADGDEYLDLGHLERGVLRAAGAITPLRHVLPRSAVNDATWREILTQLAAR